MSPVTNTDTERKRDFHNLQQIRWDMWLVLQQYPNEEDRCETHVMHLLHNGGLEWLRRC